MCIRDSLVLVLRKVFAENVVAQADRARRGRFIAGKEFDERGFSRAVHAYQRHAVAARKIELDAAEHLLGAITLR